MEALPIRYHLEFCMDSLREDAFFNLKATTPFAQFAVGDWVRPDEIGAPVDPEGQFGLTVAAVEHLLWVIEGDHIGHKVVVTLQSTAFP